MVTPPNGVYFTRSLIGGELYESITNVGNKPTVGLYGKNIETNILNFDRDVYDEIIEVFFLKKHRDEVRFKGLEELSDQLNRDRVEALRFLKAERDSVDRRLRGSVRL